MRLFSLPLLTGAALFMTLVPAARLPVPNSHPAVQAQAAQPPIADAQQLVQAYYQQLAQSVNSSNFNALVAFFSADATIDSDLSAGGAAGSSQILQLFQALPAMAGFTVDASNVQEDDPYMDVDWRWRAAPGSLRGFLDGHDTFTIQNGLITSLSQRVAAEDAAEAFMPPATGPVPTAAPVAATDVSIENYAYSPAVIQVPVGATVTWTNNDVDTHAVTTVDRLLDVGVIEQGVTVTQTFTAPGTYQYYCTIHPGMRGTVIVGVAPTAAPAR